MKQGASIPLRGLEGARAARGRGTTPSDPRVCVVVGSFCLILAILLLVMILPGPSIAPNTVPGQSPPTNWFWSYGQFAVLVVTASTMLVAGSFLLRGIKIERRP